MKSNWEKISAVLFGVIFVSALLAVAIFVPDPTPTQYATFKTILALGSAGFGAILPGMLHLNLPLSNGVVRASGAVVFFLITFLLTPPSPAQLKAEALIKNEQIIEKGGLGFINSGEIVVHGGK